MEQVTEMLTMTAGVFLFIFALAFALYTGRCVDNMFRAYEELQAPQQMLVEAGHE